MELITQVWMQSMAKEGERDTPAMEVMMIVFLTRFVMVLWKMIVLLINLELFKRAVLTDTDKNGNNSDDSGEWNGIICCIKALNLDKFLPGQFVGFTVHNKTSWGSIYK